MKKRNTPHFVGPEVVISDPCQGLTGEQVRERTQAGLAAGRPRPAGKSEPEIIFLHIFTFFNLIFAVLALLLAFSGSTIKNMAFLIVAICNALIGIVQEIRAKRAVDALTLVAARDVRVIRDGQRQLVSPEAIVRDDIAEFGPGDQICADGILCDGALQADESLLTGEADPIQKSPGDPVRSGSVVIAGRGKVRLTAVGAASFAARLAMEAKSDPKAAKSEMMRSLDRLIRVVGIALVPMGALLLYQEFSILGSSLQGSVEGTVAALVGMIPEGLYLLTSIAMAASALKLSRDKVLVQDMNCIESLARVDVLCVDKTGTITEPGMELTEVIPLTDAPCEEILSALYGGEEPENDTARALAEHFPKNPGWIPEKRIPFTSAAKWSGAVFRDRGAYLAGAPEVILGSGWPEIRYQAEAKAEAGDRVLLLARYDGIPEPNALEQEKLTPLALVVLSGSIRENAKKTFDFFEAQGVSVRVISGDNALAASRIARRAGINGADRYIDASTLTTPEDIARAAESCHVFGRVTPDQKKAIVAALQAQGHNVAMTGDGVNDLLAMKQADCSIAMASGAQAASQAASMVLLESDFSAMPGIVDEGRRVINNIQRSAALFLVKNIFSALLCLISFATRWSYPFAPIHLTLISSLTIGIPSFFLAMEPNYARIRGRFLPNVLRRALPGGLTNVLAVVLAQFLAPALGVSPEQLPTVCAGILGAVGLLVLFQVCRPFGFFRKLLWGAAAAALVLSFTLLGSLFELPAGDLRSLGVMACLILTTPVIYFPLEKLVDKFHTTQK